MSPRIERHQRAVLLVIAASLLALLALAKALVIRHHHRGAELAFACGPQHGACCCAPDHCGCCEPDVAPPGDAAPHAGEHCDCGCDPQADDPVRLEPGLPAPQVRAAASLGMFATLRVRPARPRLAQVPPTRFATGPPPPRIDTHLRLHATNVLML
ncbi:MAG: hypothetical protein IPK26_17055 [Planctomycetes bacterium]|nr:hypothetical protein [Planctomycetota bacterium]